MPPVSWKTSRSLALFVAQLQDGLHGASVCREKPRAAVSCRQAGLFAGISKVAAFGTADCDAAAEWLLEN